MWSKLHVRGGRERHLCHQDNTGVERSITSVQMLRFRICDQFEGREAALDWRTCGWGLRLGGRGVTTQGLHLRHSSLHFAQVWFHVLSWWLLGDVLRSFVGLVVGGEGGRHHTPRRVHRLLCMGLWGVNPLEGCGFALKQLNKSTTQRKARKNVQVCVQSVCWLKIKNCTLPLKNE